MISQEEKDKIAKQHFGLASNYAKHLMKYHPEDEYEEIHSRCLEAFCVALNKYDPERGAFPPYYFKVARGVLWRISRYNRANKRVPRHSIVSLDAELELNEDECFNLHELVADPSSMDDYDLIDWQQTLVQSIAQLYDEKEIEIINYVLSGYTLRDIAHIYNIDQMSCYNRWYRALTSLKTIVRDNIGKRRTWYPIKRKW